MLSRYLYPLPTLHRRIVGADAGHGPVGRGGCVGHGGAILRDCINELVRQVGVRTAVAAALDKGRVFVFFVVDASLGKRLDFSR